MNDAETSPRLSVRIARSLGDVKADAWDACANPTAEALTAHPMPDAPRGQKERFNPFVSHAFLSALEQSGSATGKTGWGGAHILVEDETGALLGCAPAYLKTHSMGEYVFDYAWADAYERAGGRYYPKLLAAVPFTPAQGRRLLVAPGPRADTARRALAAGLKSLAEKAGASSIHVNFGVDADNAVLAETGFLPRTNKQFHFFNQGYGTFDGFLAALSSRKRKTIKRERRDALANDIAIEWVTGDAITEAHWDAFFSFYMDTGSRKWGRPYLTRQYYSLAGESLRHRILLVMAKRNGRYVAGAINFIGDDALYGRNWGCVEDHPFLHFEVCYYQAIQFAIERGLSRVEAGAQGEHKLLRGYEPVTTHSAHYFSDPRLSRAVADFLQHEREQIAEAIEMYGQYVPFRKDQAREAEQDY
ncbi:MAG: GNAT family N-acetyltransferase [Beijerinckiaceae bacterium]